MQIGTGRPPCAAPRRHHGSCAFPILGEVSCKGGTQPRRAKDATAALVAGGRETERRARSRAGRVHVGRSTTDRAVAETIRRTEHAAQGGAVSVRDVDAQSVHQPRGADAACGQAPGAGAREARAPRSLRTKLTACEAHASSSQRHTRTGTGWPPSSGSWRSGAASASFCWRQLRAMGAIVDTTQEAGSNRRGETPSASGVQPQPGEWTRVGGSEASRRSTSSRVWSWVGSGPESARSSDGPSRVEQQIIEST